ncbi:helix-turn-helix domain-containing protein [Paenibacillus nicotianae]|uniref:Helix-turn-helix domain-containing protein n=1 Tax=Paenibacillus nicotianae TaxID=1526551 RepID=A0ABW4UTC7_9BACL
MNITFPSSSLSMMPIQFGFELETNSYMEQNLTRRLGRPILYYEFNLGKQKDHIHVVPDGCVDVLFACHPEYPYAEVCGSVLQARTMFFVANIHYFGVRFLPGMGVNHLPLKELVEQRIPLQDILNVSGDLFQPIYEGVTFQERIHWFDAHILPFLIQGYSSDLIQYCLQEIAIVQGNITIGELSQSTGYSTRYLRKKFEDSLGFSPKLFAQIVRFQHSLHMIMQKDIELLDIVHEQGYYDHSHFVNNFKKFSHLSPHQLRSEMSLRRNVPEIALF